MLLACYSSSSRQTANYGTRNQESRTRWHGFSITIQAFTSGYCSSESGQQCAPTPLPCLLAAALDSIICVGRCIGHTCNFYCVNRSAITCTSIYMQVAENLLHAHSGMEPRKTATCSSKRSTPSICTSLPGSCKGKIV